MRWIRRNVNFLATTMAVCCLLEVVFHLTEGTKPNTQFPWGHYRLTIAAFGVVFLAIAWLTRTPRVPLDVSEQRPAEQRVEPRRPSKRRR